MSSRLPASSSDWLFQSALWDLDTVLYRSAPSSLRCKDGNPFRVVCDLVAARVIPVGRIESWFYKNNDDWGRRWGFVCRNQYPTWTDGYEVHQEVDDGVGNTNIRFYRDGVLVKDVSIAEPPVDTWFKRRLTFWESGGWFIMRVERWNGSAWVQDVTDYLDASPLYANAAQNRCGLYFLSHASLDLVRADDTIIYKEV